MWVFQTEDAKAWYGNHVRHGVVIPNAINEAFIKPPYEGERRKVIATAGRLSAQKNFGLLINAFADIAEDFPDYSLEIYGEGEKRSELEALAEKRGVAHRVKMPGYTTSLGEKIQDVTLFVLSSDYEGMPNALMEAMALGLPCISTDCPVGGPRCLIKCGLNGVLVPINDARALSSEITKVLQNSSYRDNLGHEASKVRIDFNPIIIYDKWRKIVQMM